MPSDRDKGRDGGAASFRSGPFRRRREKLSPGRGKRWISQKPVSMSRNRLSLGRARRYGREASGARRLGDGGRLRALTRALPCRCTSALRPEVSPAAPKAWPRRSEQCPALAPLLSKGVSGPAKSRALCRNAARRAFAAAGLPALHPPGSAREARWRNSIGARWKEEDWATGCQAEGRMDRRLRAGRVPRYGKLATGRNWRVRQGIL
jgi:hypothetical protein